MPDPKPARNEPTAKDRAMEMLQEAAILAMNAGALGAQLVPDLAGIAVGTSVVGGVIDAKDTLQGAQAVKGDIRSLMQRGKVEKAMIAAQNDPEIQGLLAMRTYATAALKLHADAEAGEMQKIERLKSLHELGMRRENDPSIPLPDDLTLAEKALMEADGPVRDATIFEQVELHEAKIASMAPAKDQLNTVVNDINSHPRLASAEFRELEAKYDLEKKLGSIGQKTVRDLVSTTKSAISAGGNVIGTVSAALGAAQLPAAVATAAAGVVGSGASIAVGSIMVVEGAIEVGKGLVEINALSKHGKRADQAGQEAMKSSVQETDIEMKQDQQMTAFCMARVSDVAEQQKHQKAFKVVEAVGVIAMGTGAITVGVGGIAAAAGAGGMGVGAAPGLAVTAVGGGLMVAGGGVVITAKAGAAAAKYFANRSDKQDLKVAQLALEAAGMYSATQNGQTPDGITPEHIKALNKVKQDLKGTLRAMGVNDEKVIAQMLNDHQQVRHFAACVVVHKDTKLAAATLSQMALKECFGAQLDRATMAAQRRAGQMTPGKAVNLVETDLPKNTPAINALRKLGMSDQKIVQTVNALASHQTREIGEQKIQKVTGLRR